MGSLKIEKILREVKELPPMPYTVEKVMRMMKDKERSMQEISKTISLDQSLAFKVLRLCNSAYYGIPRKVTSINQAVVLLGCNNIWNAVIASFAHSVMNKALKGYMLQKGDLWRHSVACAFGCEFLAQLRARPLKDSAFTAGLIHDIGKVILDTYVYEEYEKIVQLTQERGMPFMLVEKEVLGFDHAEVGARMAAHWNLPAELVHAIRFHHQPELATGDERLVFLVHIVDAFCMMMGTGVGGDGLCYPVSNQAYPILGIDPAEEEEILFKLAKQIEQVEVFSPAES